jgi:hypothetical protein
VLLAGSRDVLVAIVVGVPGALVFEVFFVVARGVVLPGGRLGFGHAGGVLSEEFVDEGLFLHGVDVHVGDGGEVLDWEFCVGVSAPVCLNTLHVPLVDNCDGVLGFETEDLAEDAFVSMVDQNGLLLGSGFAEKSHEEVDAAAIHRLRKGLTASDIDSLVEILVLTGPGGGGVEGGEESPPEEGVEVEIGLQSQGFNGDGIKLHPTEHLLRIILGSILEGICGL